MRAERVGKLVRRAFRLRCPGVELLEVRLRARLYALQAGLCREAFGLGLLYLMPIGKEGDGDACDDAVVAVAPRRWVHAIAQGESGQPLLPADFHLPLCRRLSLAQGLQLGQRVEGFEAEGIEILRQGVRHRIGGILEGNRLPAIERRQFPQLRLPRYLVLPIAVPRIQQLQFYLISLDNVRIALFEPLGIEAA